MNWLPKTSFGGISNAPASCGRILAFPQGRRRARLFLMVKINRSRLFVPGTNQALDDGENKRGRDAEH